MSVDYYIVFLSNSKVTFHFDTNSSNKTTLIIICIGKQVKLAKFLEQQNMVVHCMHNEKKALKMQLNTIVFIVKFAPAMQGFKRLKVSQTPQICVEHCTYTIQIKPCWSPSGEAESSTKAPTCWKNCRCSCSCELTSVSLLIEGTTNEAKCFWPRLLGHRSNWKFRGLLPAFSRSLRDQEDISGTGIEISVSELWEQKVNALPS